MLRSLLHPAVSPLQIPSTVYDVTNTPFPLSPSTPPPKPTHVIGPVSDGCYPRPTPAIGPDTTDTGTTPRPNPATVHDVTAIALPDTCGSLRCDDPRLTTKPP